MRADGVVLKALDQQPPDIVVAPTLNRTWLEVAVAAHFPKRPSRRLRKPRGRPSVCERAATQVG